MSYIHFHINIQYYQGQNIQYYKDKNLCRFGDTCWYSHEDNEVQNVSNNQDFQDGQVTLPPEIKLMVSTMMEKAIEIWQQKGSREGSARSQGH